VAAAKPHLSTMRFAGSVGALTLSLAVASARAQLYGSTLAFSSALASWEKASEQVLALNVAPEDSEGHMVLANGTLLTFSIEEEHAAGQNWTSCTLPEGTAAVLAVCHSTPCMRSGPDTMFWATRAPPAADAAVVRLFASNCTIAEPEAISTAALQALGLDDSIGPLALDALQRHMILASGGAKPAEGTDQRGSHRVVWIDLGTNVATLYRIDLADDSLILDLFALSPPSALYGYLAGLLVRGEDGRSDIFAFPYKQQANYSISVNLTNPAELDPVEIDQKFASLHSTRLGAFQLSLSNETSTTGGFKVLGTSAVAEGEMLAIVASDQAEPDALKFAVFNFDVPTQPSSSPSGPQSPGTPGPTPSPTPSPNSGPVSAPTESPQPTPAPLTPGPTRSPTPPPSHPTVSPSGSEEDDDSRAGIGLGGAILGLLLAGACLGGVCRCRSLSPRGSYLAGGDMPSETFGDFEMLDRGAFLEGGEEGRFVNDNRVAVI